MKYLQLIVLLILLNGNTINAQHFLGGNMYINADTLNNDVFLECYLDLYYTVQDSIKDSVKVKVNGGITFLRPEEYLTKLSEVQLSNNLYKVRYGEGIFTSLPQDQTISFRYTENTNCTDVVNVLNNDYAISVALSFVYPTSITSIYVHTRKVPNFDNEIFQINHQGDSSYLNYQSTNSYADSIKYTLSQVWTLGLSDTSTVPNDFVLTDDGLLKWDTTLTGKYLIKVGVLQYRGGGVLSASYSAIIIDTDNTDSLNVNTYFQPTSRLDVDIFPNPTSDLLQITTQKPLNEIQLYNTLGQQVYQQQGLQQTEVRINVGDLPKGMYIVRVRQGEVWGSEQVLIQ